MSLEEVSRGCLIRNDSPHLIKGRKVLIFVIMEKRSEVSIDSSLIQFPSPLICVFRKPRFSRPYNRIVFVCWFHEFVPSIRVAE